MKRIGCLGQLLMLCVLCCVIAMGVALVTAPWIFTVGGRTRLLPFWSGVGTIPGPGGEYRVFVQFRPATSGSKILPSTSVEGGAMICTPAGRAYNLRLRGGVNENIWRTMDGKPFALRTWYRPAFSYSTAHLPPQLQFNGRWVGPDLEMNDRGSVAGAFLADGSLNPHPPAIRSQNTGSPIKFTERSWWIGNPCH